MNKESKVLVLLETYIKVTYLLTLAVPQEKTNR